MFVGKLVFTVYCCKRQIFVVKSEILQNGDLHKITTMLENCDFCVSATLCSVTFCRKIMTFTKHFEIKITTLS